MDIERLHAIKNSILSTSTEDTKWLISIIEQRYPSNKILFDGTILEVGKDYLYSGNYKDPDDNKWHNILVTIKCITDNNIQVYDRDEGILNFDDFQIRDQNIIFTNIKESSTMNIDHITDAELSAEIKRRELIKLKNEIPKVLSTPDFSTLINTCNAYIDEVYKHRATDSDSKQYIFEEAMNCLYGKSVWNWINKNDF